MLNNSPSSPESWVALIYCKKHLNITFIDHLKKKKVLFQLKPSPEDDFLKFICYY